MRERDALEDQLAAIGRIEQELDDQLTMLELGESEKDDKTVSDAEAGAQAAARRSWRGASWRRCCRARPTPMTAISKFMPAPAAPRARIGPAC